MAMIHPLREAALKDIEAARPVTPEALLHRAQTRALLFLADQIIELIETLRPMGSAIAVEEMDPATVSALQRQLNEALNSRGD